MESLSLGIVNMECEVSGSELVAHNSKGRIIRTVAAFTMFIALVCTIFSYIQAYTRTLSQVKSFFFNMDILWENDNNNACVTLKSLWCFAIQNIIMHNRLN